MNLIPKHIFFTRGVGRSKAKLASFELALRDAGIERFNLVTVSSIFPPACTIVSKEAGEPMLSSGGIVHCVLARQDTNEPGRLITSAIGLAVPKDHEHQYGYLSEHHAYGETHDFSADFAEDLAATMLATTLNIDFDSNLAWDERERVYKASGKIFETRSICQEASGDANGLWTTVIAAGVFVMGG